MAKHGGVIMEWIANHWKEVLDVLAYVVLGASVVSKMTKNVWDDKIVAMLLRILSLAPSNPAKKK